MAISGGKWKRKKPHLVKKGDLFLWDIERPTKSLHTGRAVWMMLDDKEFLRILVKLDVLGNLIIDDNPERDPQHLVMRGNPEPDLSIVVWEWE